MRINKYLQVMLIAMFSVLTYRYQEYNIGYTLFIPIVFFIAFYNEKSLLLLIPLSIASIFVLAKVGIFELLILYCFLIIYLLVIKRKNKLLLDMIYIFILSFCLKVINSSIDINYLIISALYSMVSVILYGYFRYNIEGVLLKQNTFRNFGMIEAIVGFVCTLGGASISIDGINVGLLVAVFFTMYLSSNSYYMASFTFSMLNMFIMLFVGNINEAILLVLIAAVYSLKGLYGAVTIISFCLIGWLVGSMQMNEVVLQLIIGIALFFEVFKSLIIGSKNTNGEIIENIYEKTIDEVNSEVLSFASFLDLFAKDFSTTAEYNKLLGDGINHLMHCYCSMCHNKDNCLSSKATLYKHLKSLILYSKRSDFETFDEELTSFFKKCPYAVEMRKSSMIANEKLNFKETYNKQQTLIAQINGISNILRQFTTDSTAKMTIDYNVFLNIKKALKDYGFNICFFNIKKAYTDDFLIEVSIRSVSYNDAKEVVEKICNNYIINKAGTVYIKAERGKTYFNIVPKINYLVDYGFGSLAKDGNIVNGDNFIIKELPSAKIIAAISDGMGKGYVANAISANTIRLVDEITKTALTRSTALQILNTFYFIQDYLEKYSTLDFVEVDKSTGELFFYKMGATTSYLFHKNGSFEKIENTNLPFGLEEIVEMKKYQASDGDVIVLTSDGVLENIVEGDVIENKIKQVLHLTSQNIAYEITNFARSANRKDNDDISVITLKIALA